MVAIRLRSMVVIASGLLLLQRSTGLIVEVILAIIVVDDCLAKSGQLDAHILVHHQKVVGSEGTMSEAHVAQEVHSHAQLTCHKLNLLLGQWSTTFGFDVVDHVAEGCQLLEDVHAVILRDDVPSLQVGERRSV